MLAKLAYSGAPLETARAAVILVHGRGASAESMLSLGEALDPEGALNLAYLAPQAPGFTWYPYSFLAPTEQNEPYLSRGLQTLADLLDQVAQAGLPPERVALVGFSQGACLALEFSVRHAQRFGAIVGLSGGLIGPPGTTWPASGSFAGTPVFLGCSDIDPHIPEERVRESARVFERLGAQVTLRIYPRMSHTIIEDEIIFVQEMLKGLVGVARDTH